MTFSEAWQRVKNENDGLHAARTEIEHARHKQQAAKSLYLPEVGLSASYIHLDDAVELSPDDILDSMPAGEHLRPVIGSLAGAFRLSPDQLNSGLTSTITDQDHVSSMLTATWPVYTGGRITAAQQIASGQTDEAEFTFRQQLIGQFDSLVRYYFSAVLARQIHHTRLSVEEGLARHRDHAVLLEQQGQIAKVERMQAEAALDKAKVERRKAERDLDIARLALSRLLKSRETILPADTLFLTDTLPPMDAFLQKTLRDYPALGALDAKKKQATGLVDVEKGKFLPTVALQGNVNLYEEDELLNSLIPDWFVGIGVSVPLIDRSGRLEQYNAAKSTVRRLDFLQLQARSDLTVLVEKTYRQAEQALEEYHGLESSLRLAEETVKLRRTAFSQGLSTSLDVVDAELFLAGVKTQQAVAEYTAIVSLAQLLAASSDQESFTHYQNSTTAGHN